MVGKPKPMSQIKQLLRLYQQGKSLKSIARSTGLSRCTVKAYLGDYSGQNEHPFPGKVSIALKWSHP
jgi:DNA invertase Pin-like site-specific DNA recombinase